MPEHTDGKLGIYVKDLLTGALTYIDVSTDPNQDTSVLLRNYRAVLSDTAVMFYSNSALVPEHTDGMLGIYVKNLITGELTYTDVSNNPAQNTGVLLQNYPAQLSSDGRMLLFENNDPLVPEHTDGKLGIYVKHLDYGDLLVGGTEAALRNAGQDGWSGAAPSWTPLVPHANDGFGLQSLDVVLA